VKYNWIPKKSYFIPGKKNLPRPDVIGCRVVFGLLGPRDILAQVEI